MEPSGKARSVGDRVAGATLLIAAVQIVVRAAGAAARLLAGVLGPGEFGDAYFTAENILGRSFQFKEDVMQPAFLPVFMKEMADGGERRAWRFARQVLAATAIFIGYFTLAAYVRPEALIELFGGRFDAATKRLAAAVVRVVILALPFLAVSSMTYVILNGYKRFGIPASSDAIQRAVFVAAGLAGGALLGFSPAPLVAVLSAGLVAGAISRLGTHLWGLRDKAALLFRRERREAGDPAPPWKSFVLLALPLLLSFSVALWREVNENQLASGAAKGTYTILRLTKSIWSLPVSFLPNALSIAMFPFLCEMHARGDRAELGRVVRGAFRFVLLVFVPAAGFMVALRIPIVSALYGWSPAWTDARIADAARAFGLTTWAIPIYAAEIVIVQTFYSMRRTHLPAAAGILASGLQIALSRWAVGAAGTESIGVAGIRLDVLAILALAYPVTRSLKNVFLGVALFRGLEGQERADGRAFAARLAVVAIASAAAAAAGAALADRLLPGALGLPGPVAAGHGARGEGFRLGRLLFAATLWLVAFVGTAHLLRIPEWRTLVAWVRGRLRRRGAAPPAG